MANVKALHLDRKNLIVDGKKIKRLQQALNAPSESEAVRMAVDRVLEAEDAISALERIRTRATWGKVLAS